MPVLSDIIGYVAPPPIGNDLLAQPNDRNHPATTIERAQSFGGDVVLMQSSIFDYELNLDAAESPNDHPFTVQSEIGVILNQRMHVKGWQQPVDLRGITWQNVGGAKIEHDVTGLIRFLQNVWNQPQDKAIVTDTDGKDVPAGVHIIGCDFNGPFSGEASIAFCEAWCDEFRLVQSNLRHIYDPRFNGPGECRKFSKECPEGIRIRSGSGIVDQCLFTEIHSRSCAIRFLPITGKQPIIGPWKIQNSIVDIPEFKGKDKADDLYYEAFAIDCEGTSEFFDEIRPIGLEFNFNTWLTRRSRRNINADDGWQRHFSDRPNPKADSTLLTFTGPGVPGWCERIDWQNSVCWPQKFNDPPCLPGQKTAKWSVDNTYMPLDTPANRNFVIGKGNPDPAVCPAYDFYGLPRNLDAPTVGAVEFGNDLPGRCR